MRNGYFASQSLQGGVSSADDADCGMDYSVLASRGGQDLPVWMLALRFSAVIGQSTGKDDCGETVEVKQTDQQRMRRKQ